MLLLKRLQFGAVTANQSSVAGLLNRETINVWTSSAMAQETFLGTGVAAFASGGIAAAVHRIVSMILFILFLLP